MKEYFLNDKYLFGKSNLEGAQIKYKKGNYYYYKIDKIGNEGLVEYLVSLVLECSSIKKFVYYEYCKINGKYGCRSKDFAPNSVFLTAESMYTQQTGKTNLADYLYTFSKPEERYKELLKLYRLYGLDAEYYLKCILYLDMLILNSDRHVKNFGICRDLSTGEIGFPPIFDNGLSLVKGRCSCTICGSFEMQVTATGYPVKTPFYINYNKLNEKLEKVQECYKQCREFKVLKTQLIKYKDIFEGGVV